MDGVRFAIRVSVTDEGGRTTLWVRARVDNRSASAVGLYARLRSLSPNEAYIAVEGGVLHIEKGVLRAPPDIEIPETVVPCMVRVEPGSSFREELTYPIPVVSNHPIRARVLEAESEPSEAVPDRPVEVRTVDYAMEAFFIDPSVQARPVEGHAGVYDVVLRPRRTERLSARAQLDRSIIALDYRLVRPSWAR